MPGQGLPQPGGEQRSQTKFIVFENFEKMNTQSARQSLSEKELAWLENLQPIAPNNLLTVPAPAALALATLAETLVLIFYVSIGGVDYFICFSTAGSAYAITIATGMVNQFAIDGTFSTAPDVTTWQASRILINDSIAGYCTFDGTLFVRQGGVSPNITVTAPGAYGTAPTVTITGGSGHGATAIAILTGQYVTAIQLINPGVGYAAGDTLTVTISAPPGSGATGTVTMSKSAVINLTVATPGSWINVTGPAVGNHALTFSGGGGSGAAGFATVTASGSRLFVGSVTLTAGGSGYSSPPSCTLPGVTSGNNPSFNVFLGTQTVSSINLTAGGSAYTAPPTVTIAGGSPYTQATATSTESGGAVTGLTLTNAGLYPPGVTPTVVIGAVSAATAIAHVWPFIPAGTTLAVFQSRVWLAGGQLLQWTGTGATYGNVGYDDFLAADASGSLLISDADLVHAITALRSLDNYLFIMGDQSVKQIGNISLDSTGLVTLFTILTLSSDQGTIWPKSCISYNRVFLFANVNGIYAVFGSSVQKVSADMDGIFKYTDFTKNIQGALLDLNGQHNAVFLLNYNDPVLGHERTILIVFNGQKWWVASPSTTLAAVATSAALSTGELTLYGSLTGTDVTSLFASPSIAVPFKIQTALTHHGNAVQGKQVERAGFSYDLAIGSGDVTMTIDTSALNGSSNMMAVASGFHVTGGSNDANSNPIAGGGIYLGMTITGTLAGLTMTNMLIEYQENTLWKK